MREGERVFVHNYSHFPSVVAFLLLGISSRQRAIVGLPGIVGKATLGKPPRDAGRAHMGFLDRVATTLI